MNETCFLKVTLVEPAMMVGTNSILLDGDNNTCLEPQKINSIEYKVNFKNPTLLYKISITSDTSGIKIFIYFFKSATSRIHFFSA